MDRVISTFSLLKSKLKEVFPPLERLPALFREVELCCCMAAFEIVTPSPTENLKMLSPLLDLKVISLWCCWGSAFPDQITSLFHRMLIERSSPEKPVFA